MRRSLLLAFAVAAWLAAPPVRAGIVIEQVGYGSAPLAVAPSSIAALAVDGGGNLYCAMGSAGVSRVTPMGDLSPWSTVPGDGLTLTSAGDGYSAGRALCDCIHRVESSGAFSVLHADTLEWTYVGLSPGGTLYATIWAGEGQGLYTIDRTTGDPTKIVTGGPGPGGNGTYSAFAFGADGELYTLGSLDGTIAGARLFRLDGASLTAVATLPHGGSSIAAGPAGTFYVATSFDFGSGYLFGELWSVDVATAATTLLASGTPGFHYADPMFVAVGYDPTRKRIFVAEANRQIWSIWNTTPTRRESWGALKARYAEGAGTK